VPTHWFTHDLHGLLSAPWLQIVLVLVSAACGAIIGGERERQEKAAGLRTLILVSLGSTVFTLASYAFVSSTGDSGRVAAQIVTGIGFLGAGAILHNSGIVRGMTTAATIWATAAMGMVIGIGYAGAGLGIGVLIRLVLSVLLAWEIRTLGDTKECQIDMVIDPNGGKTRARIEKIMEDFHLRQSLIISGAAPDGIIRASLKCRLPQRHHREFLYDLASLPEVKELKASEQ